MTGKQARARGLDVAILLGVVLGVLGVLWIALGYVGLRADLDRERAESRALAQQVRDLGGVPKVSPTPGPAGSPGPSGQPGPSGRAGRPPTQGEIGAAVTRFLREHPPPRGRPPSMAEVLTAVTGYLRENPPAPGPSGQPGRDGQDGEDGADGSDGRDGEPGPPPTEEQVRAAVETYLQSHPLNCPAGTALDRMTVVTTGGPREVVVCTSQ